MTPYSEQPLAGGAALQSPERKKLKNLYGRFENNSSSGASLISHSYLASAMHLPIRSQTPCRTQMLRCQEAKSNLMYIATPPLLLTSFLTLSA